MPATLASVEWPPIIAVSGRSNSGKTLLLEHLVPRLQARGLRVGVIKDCHHAIEADRPGKDSDRLFQAGADVFVQGPNEALARFRPARPWAQWVRSLFEGHDLVLAEGFREAPVPRIELDGGEDEDTLLVVCDPVAEAAAADGAVWELLQRRHETRPAVRTRLTAGGPRALLGRPTGRGKRPEVLAGALSQVREAMRLRPGARLIAAPATPEMPLSTLGWLLAQGGPGVDVVLPAGAGQNAVLLEPPARAAVEAAADGDTEAWFAMLAGNRVARPKAVGG